MPYLIAVPLFAITLGVITAIPFIRSKLRYNAFINYGVVLFAGLSVASLVFLGVTDIDAESVAHRSSPQTISGIVDCVVPSPDGTEIWFAQCPPITDSVKEELTMRARALPAFGKSCFSGSELICREVDLRIEIAGSQWTDFGKNGFYSIMACAVGVLIFGLNMPNHKKKKKRFLPVEQF